MLHHFARSCRSTYEIARRTGLTQSAVVRKLKKYGLVVGDSTDEPPSRPGRTSPSSRD